MKDVTKLTRSQLLAEIVKARMISSELCSALIEAGRGGETFLAVVCRNDPLSVKYVQARTWESELSWEKEARLKAHGKLSPLRLTCC